MLSTVSIQVIFTAKLLTQHYMIRTWKHVTIEWSNLDLYWIKPTLLTPIYGLPLVICFRESLWNTMF